MFQAVRGLAAVVPARLGGVEAPVVGEPPRTTPEQSARIRTRTGLSADEHHDRIRQAVGRVARVARRRQIEIVHRVEWLATRSEQSVLDRVRELDRIVAGAVRDVRDAFRGAREEISTAASAARERVRNHQVHSVDELDSSHETAVQRMYDALLSGNTEVQAVAQAFDTALTQRADDDGARMRAIPATGTVPGAPRSVAPSQLGDATPMHLRGQEIVGALQASGASNFETYANARKAEFVPDLAHQKQLDLERGAEARANGLCSQTTKQLLTLAMLGLIDPHAQAMAQQQQDEAALASGETLDEEDQVEAARALELAAITQAEDRANSSLRDSETTSVASIRRSGRTARGALMSQAQAVRDGLLSAAAPFADHYRRHVAQLRALVPKGRMLDWKATAPRLRAMEQAVHATYDQQLDAVQTQAREAMIPVREGVRNTQRQLGEAVDQVRDAVGSAVVRARVTIATAEMAFTGAMDTGRGSAVEAGRTQAADMAAELAEQPGGVRGAVQRWIDANVVPGFTDQLSRMATDYNAAVAAFEGDLSADGGAYASIEEAVRSELGDRAQNLDDAMPEVSAGEVAAVVAVGVFSLGLGLAVGAAVVISNDPDESKVMEEISAVPTVGRPALEDTFAGGSRGGLRDRIGRTLSTDEAAIANALLDGRNTEAAELAIANAPSWFGISYAAQNAVLRSLTPAELEGVQVPAGRDEAATEIQSLLSAVDVSMDGTYTDRRAEAAMARGLDQSVRQAGADSEAALVRTSGELESDARRRVGDTYYAAVVPQWRVDAFLDDVYREHAAQSDPTVSREEARALTSADARRRFADSATRDRVVTHSRTVGHGENAYTETWEERVPLSTEARDAVRATIERGNAADETFAARGTFFIREAESHEVGPNRTREAAAAAEDPALDRAREAWETAPEGPERESAFRQLRALQQRHHERMRLLADRLAESDRRRGISTPPLGRGRSAGTDAVATRLGTLFARDNVHGRAYGESLARQGRADLLTATLFATTGGGTREELLFHEWEGRSHRAIATAESRYAANYAGRPGYAATLREHLTGGVMPELSGDQRNRMEELLLGEPENDLDRLELSMLRYRHQRIEGTGFLASITMSDTAERQAIDARRAELTQMLRTASGDPGLQPFTSDGRLTPAARAAFDANGNFRGDTRAFAAASQEMGIAANNYRREVDRQEAAWMSGLMAFGIVLSVALLLIPGVNIVAAGIASALIMGALTIAVKQGFRGRRYGWEEMATDIAMTAVEAAAAWAGGSLARGASLAAAGEKVAGNVFVRIGGRMGARMGTFWSGVARETAQGFVTSAAGAAMQDETWDNGLGEGLGRVGRAGGRGAAVQGISAFVADGLAHRLGGGPGKAAGTLEAMLDPRRVARAPWREALLEGTTEAVGSMIGTAAGIAVDLLPGAGRRDWNWRDAAREIGVAGLRDLVQASARSGAMSYNRSRYQAMEAQLRSSGAEPTPAQLRDLRLAAISANAIGYRRDEFGKLRQDLATARTLLGAVPPAQRRAFAGLPLDALRDLRNALDSGEVTPELQMRLLAIGAKTITGFDGRAFLRELAEANQTRRAAETPERQQLIAAMPPHLRAGMAGVATSGLEGLPAEGFARLAALIAAGGGTVAERAALLRLAREHVPDLDAAAFARAVTRVVEAGQRAIDADQQAVRDRRRAVLGALPIGSRRHAAALPDDAIRTLAQALDAGTPLSPAQRDALSRAAHAANPRADTRGLLAEIDRAIDQVRATRNEARRSRRTERASALGEVDRLPGPIRGPLSALPDAQIPVLRAILASGTSTPHERAALLRAAAAETPDLDERGFLRALSEAIRLGRAASDASHARIREVRGQLLDGVPSHLRAGLAALPIAIVPPGFLRGLTGRSDVEVLTVTVAGQRRVLVSEGASADALRDEGAAIAQRRYPAWAERVAGIGPAELASWRSLPFPEQVARYRAQVRSALDAQQRLLHGYEAEVARPDAPSAVVRRWNQLVAAVRELTGLRARADGVDVAAVSRRLQPRPGFLDDPARLVRPEQPLDAVVRARIEQSTGIARSPADVEAQRQLAEMYRAMETAEVTEVRGTRVEQGVDRRGRLLVAPDGTPRGYTIRYGFDVRELSLAGGDAVTHLTVRVHLAPGSPAITPADVARVRANVETGVDRYYNHQHQVTNRDGRPSRLHVEVEFVADPSRAHLVVDLQPGKGAAFQNRWFVDGDPTVHAHEIGHQLGLVDEYVDHGPHGFRARDRVRPTSAGVYRDHGLMGNFWSSPGTVDARTHLPRRNLDQIQGLIDAARPRPSPEVARIEGMLGVGRSAELARMADHYRRQEGRPRAGPLGVLDRLVDGWRSVVRRFARTAVLHEGRPPPGPDDPALRREIDELLRTFPAHEQAQLRNMFRSDADLHAYLRAEAWLEGLPTTDTHLHTVSLLAAEDMALVVSQIGAARGARGAATARALIDVLLPPAARAALGPDIDAWLALVRTGARPPVPDALMTALRAAVTLPLTHDQARPLQDAFFAMYAAVGGEFFGTGGAQAHRQGLLAALARLSGRGVALVELRGKPAEAEPLETHPLVAGTIYNFTRGRVPLLVDAFLTAARRSASILGLDLGGIETTRTDAAELRVPVRDEARRNLDAFQRWFQANPALTAALEGFLAARAVGRQGGTGRTYLDAMAARAGLTLDQVLRGPAIAIADDVDIDRIGALRRFTRALRDAMTEMGAMAPGSARSLLPDPRVARSSGSTTDRLALLGFVAHGGEQVNASTVRLTSQLDDLDTLLRLGVDRIGHGVLLGLPFVRRQGGVTEPHEDNLRFLGFVRDPQTGDWVRGAERYAAADLARLDWRRAAIVQRIIADGVTIELNITSNLVLLALQRPHGPLRFLLDTVGAPPLRLSVNTDNPARHGTDVRRELSYLLATGLIRAPQAVLFTLEGFASRLGARPIADADALADRVLAFVDARLHPGELRELVEALDRRYPGMLNQVERAMHDPALAREYLRAYLRQVFQGPGTLGTPVGAPP